MEEPVTIPGDIHSSLGVGRLALKLDIAFLGYQRLFNRNHLAFHLRDRQLFVYHHRWLAAHRRRLGKRG